MTDTEHERTSADDGHEELPTWWCDNVDALRDQVELTLRLAPPPGAVVAIEPGSYILWTESQTPAMIQVHDDLQGVEVQAPLVSGVAVSNRTGRLIHRLNRSNPILKYWLNEDGLLMGSVRISAHPFVGQQLVEAIEICLAATLAASELAAICGGRALGR